MVRAHGASCQGSPPESLPVSWWSLATWAAIAVLVFGASGIFVWFLGDVTRIVKGDPGPSEEEEGT